MTSLFYELHLLVPIHYLCISRIGCTINIAIHANAWSAFNPCFKCRAVHCKVFAILEDLHFWSILLSYTTKIFKFLRLRWYYVVRTLPAQYAVHSSCVIIGTGKSTAFHVMYTWSGFMQTVVCECITFNPEHYHKVGSVCQNAALTEKLQLRCNHPLSHDVRWGNKGARRLFLMDGTDKPIQLCWIWIDSDESCCNMLSKCGCFNRLAKFAFARSTPAIV